MEEQEKLNKSMLTLIEERDKRLAARGVHTMEEHIAEIEEQNQRMLDQINDSRQVTSEKLVPNILYIWINTRVD